MKGVSAAQNAWNQQYGYEFDNGHNHYGYQKMGGHQFTHNLNNPYGINSKHGNGWQDGRLKTTNMAYNPSTNKVWIGNGDGTSKTFDSSVDYEMGDNGAYKVARQMAKGNGVYKNGKWN